MGLSALGIFSAASGAAKSVVSGGTLSSDATYFYRAFTGNGDLVVSDAPLIADLLVIAGGGSGGAYYAGGGGAGGVSYLESATVPVGTHAAVIGAGGAGIVGPAQGLDGVSSTFRSITSNGGGGGGKWNAGTGAVGNNGGSGGGGSMGDAAGDTRAGGTSNQGGTGGATGYGNAGGTGYRGTGTSFRGGGGGGSSAAGVSTPINNNVDPGSDGGAGLDTWSTWLTATALGVGGRIAGGGGASSEGTIPGAGGSGGGGRGAYGGSLANETAVAGTVNTGSGGGADGAFGRTTGAGGSGLVIVRYLKTAV
jgi:hypothetical protein